MRSFRYWVDYVMGRIKSVVPETDRLPASRGPGERKSMGRRQGRHAAPRAREQGGGLSSRLDDADKATATMLTPIINALEHGISHDIASLLAENPDELSAYEIAHCMLRANALLQYLIAQTEDWRHGESLHDLADRVASRWRKLFTGRTLRAWLSSFLDNDLKFPLHGRGKWARELLILEEDMLLKFKRWLIGRVKKDDLSVDLAHAFINEQLLKPLTETEAGREERGLRVPRMVVKIPDDDLHRDQSLSMTHVLSQCEDFRNEVTALQEILSRRGHILMMTP